MANTRITQGVIKPNEDYDVRHINATGIITATNLNLTGVLTYEDVTNVDSIGVITARKGIVSSGVVTATAFHGSGASLTGIDATALKDTGGNIKIQAQASGAVYTGIHTFSSAIDIGSNIKIGNAGVVTATSFTGSGANLTSLPAANLTGALPAISGANLTNLPPSAPVGGASTNTVFFENDKAVAVNYQITSTKNAMSAGPIAINAGIAVTVPSGSSWTIV